MKYLFAAIDAKTARSRDGQRDRSGRSRFRYPPEELKRLVVEASEAVDDKSAANDFQETLERIVNEIRNTTEHSGPFLQKVRKSDVPDYYDVIKRPMDLATLLKKVKQQSYRTKRAFAEDIDLIWSNCLLYNSHPAHPLRANAEALRTKSNQLLEFITDPSATQRNLLAASLSSAAIDMRRGSRIGTPDDDGDADGESDDEKRSLRARSERLLNGVNGDYRDSASPGPSRSQTPALSRRLSRRVSQGPLGRISASPDLDEEDATPTTLPFEEHPAFIRTSEGMQTFLLLDTELARLEGGFGAKPSKSASSSLLPPSAFEASSTLTAPTRKGKGKARVLSHIRQLNPSLLPVPLSPAPPPKPANGVSASTNGDVDTPSTIATPTAALPPPPPPQSAKRNPDEPLEAIWWDVVASSSSSAQLFPPSHSAPATTANGNGLSNGTGAHDAPPPLPPAFAFNAPPAMAAGMPRVPWVGYCATPYETVAVAKKGKGKGKGKAIEMELASESAPKVKKGKGRRKRTKERAGGGGAEVGLGPKMRKNCETLRRIRNVGSRLARESTGGDLDAYDLSSSDYLSEEDDEDELPTANGDDAMDVDPASTSVATTPAATSKKRPRAPRSVAVATSIPRKAFRCPSTAPAAAKEAMKAATGGVLGHAGFEGASAGALDVLSHLASEYIVNLGKTLRFYSDRYGADLTPSQILNNTLSENGVPSPSVLESYVTEDIDRYGSRLSDLLRKLERTREEQLDAASLPGDDATAAEALLLDEDGTALASGEFADKIGEDFFGMAELGVEKERIAASASLVPPPWLFKGVERPDTVESGVTLTYSPPPAFIPLTAEAIPSQIGLLQPYFTLRPLLRPDLALHDDVTAFSLNPASASIGRPKGTARHKVSGTLGRIPFKGNQRRPEDPTLPAGMAAAAMASFEPVKKKKKKAVVIEESGAE